jgi:REP element-mobilizing transposase RayT
MSTPSRLKSFDYIGEHWYFVTCCTDQRKRAFTDSEVVDAVRDDIFWTCEQRYFISRILLFMPDHVHFLVTGEMPNAEFRPFMKVLRQRTAVAYRRLRNDRLWQPGYYDRVLRPTDNWIDVEYYIRDNPVAAGLAGRWSDYPYCYLGHSAAPVRLDATVERAQL